jgi:hypothetical protein
MGGEEVRVRGGGEKVGAGWGDGGRGGGGREGEGGESERAVGWERDLCQPLSPLWLGAMLAIAE